MREAVIVAYGRSAIGKSGKGSLKDTRPESIAAQVIKGVLAKVPQVDKTDIEDLVLGCAMPEAEQGLNIGRMVALLADLPYEVPGQTINRFCSSGLQAISIAANSIVAGQMDVVLAGGVESMSSVPMGGNIPVTNLELIEKVPGAYVSMGVTAENVAMKYNISREKQDKFALLSHKKASSAQKAGLFDDEIVPIKAARAVNNNGTMVTGEFAFKLDEGIRENTSLDILKKLRTVFKKDGTVTAANSSQT